LPAIFAAAALEPLWVNLFPVSVTRMGTPPASVWQVRRDAVQAMAAAAVDATVRALADEYARALDAYEKDASAAGPGFVEIQNTMLFATVGQKAE
jgi:hypothetical protein